MMNCHGDETVGVDCIIAKSWEKLLKSLESGKERWKEKPTRVSVLEQLFGSQTLAIPKAVWSSLFERRVKLHHKLSVNQGSVGDVEHY